MSIYIPHKKLREANDIASDKKKIMPSELNLSVIKQFARSYRLESRINLPDYGFILN